MLDKQFLFCFCLGPEYRFVKTDEGSVLKGLKHIMPRGVTITARIRYLGNCAEDVYFRWPQILEGEWYAITLSCNSALRLQYDFSNVLRRNGQFFSGDFRERAPVVAFALGGEIDCSKINIHLYSDPEPKFNQSYRFERLEGLLLTPFLDNFIL